jgi:hypothetical protein
MTDMDALTNWMAGYLRAWDTNDPADIGSLFTDDALYYPEPFEEPYRGRDEIVAKWVARKDEPGDYAFDWTPLVATPKVSVITGTTRYPTITYSNLWVIRLTEDGRAREFTEWWMDHSKSS